MIIGNTWWSLNVFTESSTIHVDSPSIKNPIASNAIMVSVLKNPWILCFLYTIFSIIWMTGGCTICGCGAVNSCLGCGGGVYTGTDSFVADGVSIFFSGSKLFPNVFSTKFFASTMIFYTKILKIQKSILIFVTFLFVERIFNLFEFCLRFLSICCYRIIYFNNLSVVCFGIVYSKVWNSCFICSYFSWIHN